MKATAIKEEKFTYQDYINFPDNGKRYQIINGKVYMSPAPVPYHQEILWNLAQLLDRFVRKNKTGKIFIAPCDVVLSDEDIVQPDIFFISQEKLSIITDKCIEGAPDLIVEITSPYTQKLDRLFKKKLYETYKVKEYWVVDVDKKTIEIFSLKGKSYESIVQAGEMVESALFKGLKFNQREIF